MPDLETACECFETNSKEKSRAGFACVTVWNVSTIAEAMAE